MGGYATRRGTAWPVRFWCYVNRDTADRCWEWNGTLNSNGYGVFKRDNRSINAHRASWELHNGSPVPDGLQVCHTCDNRPCVNPHHLWLGTAADNNRDQIQKGRNTSRFHGKVDWVLGKTLRRDGHSIRAVARRLGVSHTAVQKAIKRGCC
jgi:hypothetical protein